MCTNLTTDMLFKIRIYFAKISGMQVCGWWDDFTELSACDIVPVQLACGHTILAWSGQFGSWVWRFVELYPCINHTCFL